MPSPAGPNAAARPARRRRPGAPCLLDRPTTGLKQRSGTRCAAPAAAGVREAARGAHVPGACSRSRRAARARRYQQSQRGLRPALQYRAEVIGAPFPNVSDMS